MLGMLTSVNAFLKNTPGFREQDAFWQGVRDRHVENLRTKLRDVKGGGLDAARLALDWLVEEQDCVYNEQQRAELARIISDVATENTTGETSGVAHGGYIAQQCLHFETYLTARDWEVLQDSAQNLDQKVSVIVSRALAIGLKSPSEKTIVSIVNVLSMACGGVSASKSLELVDLVKGTIKKLRGARDVNTRVYPDDGKMYAASHPDVYSASAPPIAPPFGNVQVELSRQAVVARKSHKNIRQQTSASSCAAPAETPEQFLTRQLSQFMAGLVTGKKEPQASRASASAGAFPKDAMGTHKTIRKMTQTSNQGRPMARCLRHSAAQFLCAPSH